MDNNAILQKVIAMFATMSDTEEEITADSELIEDLGVSSMDILLLISSMEDEFKIKIPEKLIRKMTTIEDVADIIASLLNQDN